MSRTAIAVSKSLILFALVTSTPTVQALDNPFIPARPKVDCDKKENANCRECCSGGFECANSNPNDVKIFCCRDPDNCDVVNAPPDAGKLISNIKLDLAVSTSRLMFKRIERVDRRTGQRFYEIALRQGFRTLGRRAQFRMAAKLGGADAAVASLLYAVVFLDRGHDTLAALQARGYDVSLIGEPPALTCPDAFKEICLKLGDQLAQGISASLAGGTAGERQPFEQGLATFECAASVC